MNQILTEGQPQVSPGTGQPAHIIQYFWCGFSNFLLTNEARNVLVFSVNPVVADSSIFTLLNTLGGQKGTLIHQHALSQSNSLSKEQRRSVYNPNFSSVTSSVFRMSLVHCFYTKYRCFIAILRIKYHLFYFKALKLAINHVITHI